ncbi:MAG: recombinase family protein, partial [Firmicutes bacterium]|nr:recombinase family protein [Bacillota bacterium]
ADYDVKKGLSDESNSISSQRKLLYSFINKNSEFSDCPVSEYFDDGTSGTIFEKRSKFQEMITDARKGLFDCLIIKDLSRLGRDYIEVGYYTELVFPLMNIRFISVNDKFDSDNFKGTTGGMEYALKNLMHQLYSLDLSRKVKSARITRNKAGEFTASFAPYGYERDPQNKHKLIVNEQTSKYVYRIFELAADGKSCIDIARILNECKIPTPRQEQHRANKRVDINSRNDYIWDNNYVSFILNNEIYIGNLVQNKVEIIGFGDNKKAVRKDKSEWVTVEGIVEPIVSKELFEKAKITLDKHSKQYLKRREVKYKNLFCCAYCGRKLRKTYVNGKYVCKVKSLANGKPCENIKKPVSEAHQIVLDTVKAACQLMIDNYDDIVNGKNKQNDEKTANIEVLEKELEKLKGMPIDLYKKYKSGNISREQFIKAKEAANKQSKEIEDELRLIKEQSTNIEEIEVKKEDLEECKELKEYNGDVISKIIKEVKVHGSGDMDIIFNCDDFYRDCIQLNAKRI